MAAEGKKRKGDTLSSDRWARRAGDAFKVMFEELPGSMLWVVSVLGVTWGFGYMACYFNGFKGDDSPNGLFELISGGSITLLYIIILIFIILVSDYRRLPRRFILLGVTVVAISLLVQSFSGAPIGINIFPWDKMSNVKDCRARVVEFWFGEQSFLWGIAAALFGAAWQYWDQLNKEREMWEQRREKMKQIDVSREKDSIQIQAAKEWSELKNDAEEGKDRDISEQFRNELEEIRKRHTEKWVHAILMEIDWRLFRNEKLENKETEQLIDLLIDLGERGGQNNESTGTEPETLWESIKELNNDFFSLVSVPEPDERKEILKKLQKKGLDGVFRIWKEYDILTREWVAVLIQQWIKYFPCEKTEVEDKIRDLQHTRRLVRHKKIRALFPNLAITPTYRFHSPWLASHASTLKSEIGGWLGERKNPFGMAQAEWERDIDKFYYYKLDVWDLMGAHAMAWIVAPSGSGRTALARTVYTEWAKPRSGVFPLYMPLRISHQVNVHQFLLKQLMHNLVDTWGGILRQPGNFATDEMNDASDTLAPLFNGPIAFLDLNYHEQRKVAQLLFWEMRSLDALWAWLASLRLDLTHSKEGKALKARLQFLLQFPPPLQLPEAWMMELASARPVGLESTYVIIELANDLAETQSKNVAELAYDLQKHRVYWKIITSHPSPSAYPSTRLSWSKSELVEMLETRDTDSVLQAEAIERLAQFIYEHADGLPREMMRLGNVALALRAKKEAPSPASSEDVKTEGVLTKEDIEDAIAHWQKERQHATP